MSGCHSLPAGSKDAGEDEPKTTARANFMYGQGYKYGPVDIVVTGFGFRDNEDAHDFIEGSVSHRLVFDPTCSLLANLELE